MIQFLTDYRIFRAILQIAAVSKKYPTDAYRKEIFYDQELQQKSKSLLFYYNTLFTILEKLNQEFNAILNFHTNLFYAIINFIFNSCLLICNELVEEGILRYPQSIISAALLQQKAAAQRTPPSLCCCYKGFIYGLTNASVTETSIICACNLRDLI